jgi:CHAT domain-containing protein
VGYAIWPGGVESEIVDLQARPDPTEKGLARLADLLLSPVDRRLSQLNPDDVLIISPAEEIANLPISALPYRGGALCQKTTLCFVQGLAMLEACLHRPRVSYHSLLSFGAPSRPDLPELPAALRETEGLTALFQSRNLETRCLTGERATARAFEQCIADFDSVHIACHAQSVNRDEGLALMLAPDPRRKDSGILTERRILAEVGLRPGACINLSGCATGLQRDSGRALMSGLVPAFLVGGAGCVLATLWPIKDDHALPFQLRFYSELLATRDPLKSLAVTQRCCLAGELGDDLRSWRIWAAYQMFGSGGRAASARQP